MVRDTTEIWPKQTTEERREYYRRCKEDYPELVLWRSAKTRAKSRGLLFDIEWTDIVIPDVCPYLKTPFQPGTMYAASLDRIDNSKGYVKGNVEVISRKANTMKSNATPEELLEFAYEILDRN